ncbi:MAG: PAS domain S-box protein [Deltaproteobacteria bacterium]|nr:PAS domain S-box protein [Deltaproteobacteria bacterium]
MSETKGKKNKKTDLLKILLNTTPESILITDVEGKILVANATLAKRIGKPVEEIVGLTFYDIFPEEVAKRRIDNVKEVISSKEPQIFEDEREGRYYQAHMSPIFGDSGEVEKVLIVAFDITARKQAEKKAIEERDRLFSILNSIEEAIYISDMDTYEILYANEFLKRILGRDPVGGICYKEFQGFDRPCSFCTNEIIRNLKGNPYRWEYYNPVLKRYFDITDKVITWVDGREVRFEMAVDITERKNAEIALKLNEELYRSSISNLREGFIRVTLDGKIIMVNNSYAKMYGYSSPEEMMKSVQDIGKDLYVNPEDRTKMLEMIMKYGFVENYESQRKTKDGRIIWVSTNSRAITDEQGNILYLEGTDIDITDRKKAEEKLKEERKKFGILIENLPFGAVLVDPKGKYLYANKKFTEMTGYTLEEVPDGKTFIKKAFPDEKSRLEVISLWKEDTKKFKVGESIPRTFTVTCKDGSVKRLTVTTVFVAENLYVMGYEDVTEAEKNALLLRESEKKYRSIVENASEGIFQSTLDGMYVFANPAMVKMLGYSSFEELKEAITDIRSQLYVNPADRDKFLQILKEEGKVINYETQLYRKDGNVIWVNATAWPVYDEQGNFLYIQGIAEDVTERKKKEEELNSLREQFLQAQKMEAIGRLAGGIAHDFNNVLTVILGTCQLALLSLEDKEKMRKNIETIMNSAEKAASLTRQLLAYSRRQLMQLTVLDLNKLIMSMEDMLKRLLGEEIEITTYLEKNLGKVKADPTQLQQVIINLAVNAKDAMPDGGKLILETYNVELNEDYARTHLGVSPGSYVMFSITDTGTGIPKEIMPHIFEPFFTTKQKGEGTGLGLSTVYGIVKQLGGHIYVYSEEGRGTTFKIYLPRVDEKAERPKKKERIEEKVVVPQREDDTSDRG